MSEDTSAATVMPGATAAGRGLFGWFSTWLQDTMQADQTSLRLRSDERASNDDPHHGGDERDEDLHFAAFMTGPLY